MTVGSDHWLVLGMLATSCSFQVLKDIGQNGEFHARCETLSLRSSPICTYLSDSVERSVRMKPGGRAGGGGVWLSDLAWRSVCSVPDSRVGMRAL